MCLILLYTTATMYTHTLRAHASAATMRVSYYYILLLLYVSHTTVYYCYYIYTQYSRARRCGAQSSWLSCLLSPSHTLTSCTATQPSSGFSGTQFTCFTGTKAQILTQKALLDDYLYALPLCARYSGFLLYWYKSTNTDAEGAGSLVQRYGVAVVSGTPVDKDSSQQVVRPLDVCVCVCVCCVCVCVCVCV